MVFQCRQLPAVSWPHSTLPHRAIICADHTPTTATSPDAPGVDWMPNTGGAAGGFVNMTGYEGWDQADVNGGNVIVKVLPKHLLLGTPTSIFSRTS